MTLGVVPWVIGVGQIEDWQVAYLSWYFLHWSIILELFVPLTSASTILSFKMVNAWFKSQYVIWRQALLWCYINVITRSNSGRRSYKYKCLGSPNECLLILSLWCIVMDDTCCNFMSCRINAHIICWHERYSSDTFNIQIFHNQSIYV